MLERQQAPRAPFVAETWDNTHHHRAPHHPMLRSRGYGTAALAGPAVSSRRFGESLRESESCRHRDAYRASMSAWLRGVCHRGLTAFIT
jgi:hypothetical protein